MGRLPILYPFGAEKCARAMSFGGPGGQDRDAAAPGHAGGEPGQLGRVPVGEIPGDHGSAAPRSAASRSASASRSSDSARSGRRRDSRARASLLRRAIARGRSASPEVNSRQSPRSRSEVSRSRRARPRRRRRASLLCSAPCRGSRSPRPDPTGPRESPAGRPVEPLHLDHPHFPVHVGGLRSGNSIARSGGTTWVRTGRSSQTTASPGLGAPEEVRVRARVIHVDRHHRLAEMERASVGPRDLDERPREDGCPVCCCM